MPRHCSVAAASSHAGARLGLVSRQRSPWIHRPSSMLPWIRENIHSAAMRIQSFTIMGLHGHDTVALQLVDNRLVLVGENGTGKSTVLNAMYYFLTRQWDKLGQLSLSGLSVVIDDHELTLSMDDLGRRTPVVSDNLLARYLTDITDHNTAHRIMRFLSEHPLSYWAEYPERIAEHARVYEYDAHVVINVLSHFANQSPGISDNLQKINLWMEQHLTSQVLFLPTYRRIERDLQHIFKDVRIEREARQFNRRNSKSGGYIELVEFGMRDVEALFKNSMQQLDREFRLDLNQLTAEYLRAVIRQEHTQVQHEALAISTEQIETLINRIDKILPEAERRELLALVASIRRSNQVPVEKKVVAHFLSMLVKIHERQERREARVRKLSDVCNLYFAPAKRLLFDPLQFELKFVLAASETEVSARDLSSGEKQIVSLFTHLLLSGQRSFVVLIDEPELSISVPWQRRFLTDIVSSGLCETLVAVTHSPFVFENDLAVYAHSISEFRASHNQ